MSRDPRWQVKTKPEMLSCHKGFESQDEFILGGEPLKGSFRKITVGGSVTLKLADPVRLLPDNKSLRVSARPLCLEAWAADWWCLSDWEVAPMPGYIG